jgi:hypothetical protein
LSAPCRQEKKRERAVVEQAEVILTSLPVPADVEQVALGPNGLIEGMRPDTAFFDMSTNSVAVVRKINAVFAEKNLYMLDSRSAAADRGRRAARWRSGPAATSSSSTATSLCSTRWATKPLISARSAPA